MDDAAGAALPTGRQFGISYGNYSAVVTEVGATLRSFAVAGQELLDTFELEEASDFSRGQVLLPFPNRIDGGKYTFGGVENQLPINEVPRNTAIHGLARWSNWVPVSWTPSRVELALRLYPQDGWPYIFAQQIAYELSEDGLTVTTSVTNAGPDALPFGAGYHPYMTVGTPTIDTATLKLPAASYYTTNDRLIPTGKKSVEGTDFDFREPREIGDVQMDTCFTDVIPDEDGFSRVVMTNPQTGLGIVMYMDSRHGYIQVYTGDTLPEEDLRLGIAVEPMTCAPDAFNTGDGLITLEPGESFTGVWGMIAV